MQNGRKIHDKKYLGSPDMVLQLPSFESLFILSVFKDPVESPPDVLPVPVMSAQENVVTPPTGGAGPATVLGGCGRWGGVGAPVHALLLVHLRTELTVRREEKQELVKCGDVVSVALQVPGLHLDGGCAAAQDWQEESVQVAHCQAGPEGGAVLIWQ